MDPSIGAVRKRLDAHVAAGHLHGAYRRNAARALLSPVVLLIRRQHELGVSAAHPIAADRFLDDHADRFVRGFGKG